MLNEQEWRKKTKEWQKISTCFFFIVLQLVMVYNRLLVFFFLIFVCLFCFFSAKKTWLTCFFCFPLFSTFFGSNRSNPKCPKNVRSCWEPTATRWYPQLRVASETFCRQVVLDEADGQAGPGGEGGGWVMAMLWFVDVCFPGEKMMFAKQFWIKLLKPSIRS